MKIFIVSLKDATQRRQNITKRMKDLGLSFEFFDAVDGRNGLSECYEPMIDRNAIKRRLGGMSGGEIACALSHALLYKKIVDENINNTIILEDDVILSDDFSVMVTQELCEKSGKDFIFLYHLFARAMVWGKVPFFNKYSLVKLARTPNSTAGYYLNNYMANYLYENTIPISWVADWNVNIASINSGAMVPRIVQHPAIENSGLEKNRQAIKKAFGQFGFYSYLCYKVKKIFSYKISKTVEGS